jgi:hypothetical protein
MDQLTVSYALSFVLPISNSTGSVVLAGNTYPWTAYTSNAPNAVAQNTNYLPFPYNLQRGIGFMYPSGVQSTPGGTPVPTTILTDSTFTGSGIVNESFSYSTTYVPGSYTLVFSLVFGPTAGNRIGGIQGLYIYFYPCYYCATFPVYYNFGTPIPKTSTQTLTLDFGVTWSN